MDAREYLSQAFISEQKIECLFDRLDWLNSMAERCRIRMGELPDTGIDGEPGWDLIRDIIFLERIIKDDIDDLIGLRNKIENFIIDTRDRMMIAVLKGRYLSYRSFEEISRELNCDRRTVARKHAAGLKRVQKILDMREEDGE